jgi:hypothetical protein
MASVEARFTKSLISPNFCRVEKKKAESEAQAFGKSSLIDSGLNDAFNDQLIRANHAKGNLNFATLESDAPGIPCAG